MNCFSHALPHLDDPYFAVGCCLPDWLSACDRKCRAREKKARQFIEHSDPIVSTIAQGVVRHHTDDAWFHRTPIFNNLILDFAVELRDIFGNERSMRPSLIGHILVELFLDSYLNSQFPGKLDFFYEQTKTVDAEKVQDAINLFATKPTDKLANEIERFIQARYLFDYDTDEGVIYRINRVFERISLNQIGDEIFTWMPNARTRVHKNVAGLLAEYPIEIGVEI
ncbi:MAG: hypothetical protein AB8B55_14880 [Mariniblastus sp.]